MKYLFSGDIQYVSGRKRRKRNWKKAVAVVLIVAFVGFSAASMVMIREQFQENFGRADQSERTIYETYADVSDSYGRTEVTFRSDENTLHGYLYGPSKPKGLVVISHGLGGGGESYIAETIYFVKKGYKVLAYDNTGSFESEGEGTMGLSQSVIDLDHALDYVESQEQFKDLPVFLYGHSWGGYAVTAVLNYDHKITGAVSVSGYNTPMEMLVDWCKDEMGFMTYVEYPYMWLYQKYLFGGASNLSAVEGINQTDTPVLLIHGSGDSVVPFDSAAIMAHKDEIINPSVQYLVCSKEGQDGHNNLFRAASANAYLKELEEEWAAMEDKYDGDIPEGVLDDWYDGVDKEKTSQLDEVFMQDVYDFMKGCK